MNKEQFEEIEIISRWKCDPSKYCKNNKTALKKFPQMQFEEYLA